MPECHVSTLKLWSPIILSFYLLAGCSADQALQTPQPAPSALRVPDADILPGSKGDRNAILPGSKGDRSHLASLELELSLPVDGAFTLAQLSRPEAEGWYAEVDGARPARIRLSRARPGGDGQLLTFVLEDVSLMAEVPLHELAVYSADGVLQSAALMPLPAEVTRAPELLTSQTLADWLIARKYQRGKPLQELDPAVLTQLRGTQESKALAQELKESYRQSKGKSDPRKSAQAEAKAEAAAQKQAEKDAQALSQSKDSPDKSKPPNASAKPDKDKKN